MQSNSVIIQIIFNIENGQITCASCTGTLESAMILAFNISDVLSQPTIKAYDCHSTEFPNQIKISQLILSNSEKALKAVLKECLDNINNSGFTCNEYKVYANGQEIEITALNEERDIESAKLTITDMAALASPQPVKKIDKKSISKEMLVGGGLLSLGTTLMVLEHLNQTENTFAKIVVGTISTVVSSIVGKNYILNTIKRLSPMDTLITMGSGGAILYSFLLILQPPLLKADTTSSFFDVPLMILGFLKLSHALRKLIENQIQAQEIMMNQIQENLPKTVIIEDTAYNVYEVQKGSRIVVLPGELVPIDGQLIEQQEMIHLNERLFSGNDKGVEKREGDTIYAGTKNTTRAPLILKTLSLAHESYIHRVLFSLKKSANGENMIEWIIKYFLRGVLSIATISALCWGFFGPEPSVSNAVQVFLAVILSACPCGLGLFPLNETMIKLVALSAGITIQTSKALEMHHITNICIDKCGTSTEGAFQFENVHLFEKDMNESTLLDYVIALQKAIPESEQTAMGKALLKLSPQDVYTAENYESYSANRGRGGQIQINGCRVTVGNITLMRHFGISMSKEEVTKISRGADGAMRLCCAIDGKLKGFVQLKPIMENEQIFRPHFAETIKSLILENKSVHILTGDDNLENAKSMAYFLVRHMDVYVCILEKDPSQRHLIGHNAFPMLFICTGLLPEDKKEYIHQLQLSGNKVAMLGDGTNDVPAMEQADIRLVIDNDASISESDAILNGDFSSLNQLMILSKSYEQAYQMSLTIGFGMNLGLMFASAGVFYPLTKQIVDPMIIGMGMGGSSLFLMAVIAAWKHVAQNRIESIVPTLRRPSFLKNKKDVELKNPLINSVLL